MTRSTAPEAVQLPGIDPTLLVQGATTGVLLQRGDELVKQGLAAQFARVGGIVMGTICYFENGIAVAPALQPDTTQVKNAMGIVHSSSWGLTRRGAGAFDFWVRPDPQAHGPEITFGDIRLSSSPDDPIVLNFRSGKEPGSDREDVARILDHEDPRYKESVLGLLGYIGHLGATEDEGKATGIRDLLLARTKELKRAV